MDHADLVLEMSHLERMPTAERLTLARRRRVQQLRLWAQKDRERRRPSPPRNNRHIYFGDNVMLLEAASRNDIEEGTRSLPPPITLQPYRRCTRIGSSGFFNPGGRCLGIGFGSIFGRESATRRRLNSRPGAGNNGGSCSAPEKQPTVLVR